MKHSEAGLTALLEVGRLVSCFHECDTLNFLCRTLLVPGDYCVERDRNHLSARGRA